MTPRAKEHEELAGKFLPALEALRLYHRHEVVGMTHVPETGRALIVCNHSLATYDIVLLLTSIYTDMGRLARPLIDRLFFKVPFLGDAMNMFGAVQGSQDSATSLLESDELVTVAPGGMREALRPSSERYQIRWERRLGFARLAAQTRAPIILAACPKADDLYEVYPSQVTAWAYKTFRVPVFFARGVGLSPLPRPVKLVHHLSEPQAPPELPEDPEKAEALVKEFHASLVARMRDLIRDAVL